MPDPCLLFEMLPTEDSEVEKVIKMETEIYNTPFVSELERMAMDNLYFEGLNVLDSPMFCGELGAGYEEWATDFFRQLRHYEVSGEDDYDRKHAIPDFKKLRTTYPDQFIAQHPELFVMHNINNVLLEDDGTVLEEGSSDLPNFNNEIVWVSEGQGSSGSGIQISSDSGFSSSSGSGIQSFSSSGDEEDARLGEDEIHEDHSYPCFMPAKSLKVEEVVKVEAAPAKRRVGRPRKCQVQPQPDGAVPSCSYTVAPSCSNAVAPNRSMRQAKKKAIKKISKAEAPAISLSKRAEHNEMERRRRQELKALFDQLKTLVPRSLLVDDKGKIRTNPSKNTVVNGASKHLLNIQEERDAKITLLKQKKKLLKLAKRLKKRLRKSEAYRRRC